MARTLTGSVSGIAVQGVVRPALLASIESASGYVRAWTGIGEIQFDGSTYYGVGTFGGVTQVEEQNDLTARGLTFYLSGIPSEYVSLVLGDIKHNRQAKLWLGFVTDSMTLVSSPVLMFEGLTDVAKIQESGDVSIVQINAEHKLAKLKRATHRYYSPEDQKREYPGDLGFDYVHQLQQKSIVWKFVETSWEEYFRRAPPSPEYDNSQG